jgi:hypothetical protein
MDMEDLSEDIDILGCKNSEVEFQEGPIGLKYGGEFIIVYSKKNKK